MWCRRDEEHDTCKAVGARCACSCHGAGGQGPPPVAAGKPCSPKAQRPTGELLAKLDEHLVRAGVTPRQLTPSETAWLDAQEQQRRLEARQAEAWLRVCPPKFRDVDLS